MSIGRLAIVTCAAALTAGPAFAQSDPFGALYAPPGGAASGPSSATGVTSVETAVGRSYAGSREHGVMSAAQLAFLPRTVAPFPLTVTGSNEKALAKKPRVAVIMYGLGVARGAQASASGAGAGSELTPRRTKVATFLDGVSDDLAAKLADEAYADLTARLQAAGFAVVPATEVAASPKMQTVAKYEGAYAHGKNAFSAWAVYAPRAAPSIKGYAGEQGMAALSAPAANIAMGQVSKELDAVLLAPRLMLDNVQLDSTGQRSFVANASVDAKVRFSVTGGALFFYGNERGGTMGGGFTLKPYGSDEPFALMVKADDRSDSKAMHNALAVAGFGSLYRQSLVYAVQADPHRFAALSRAAFQGYNAALVDQIRRARSR